MAAAAGAQFTADQAGVDPRVAQVAAKLDASVARALAVTPRASFGEGLPMPPPGSTMTQDELLFQLLQLTGRQVVAVCSFAPGAAPDTVSGVVEIAGRAIGIRFSPIYSGVAGCTPYVGAPAYVDLADPQFQLSYVVGTSPWMQHHYSLLQQQLTAAQAGQRAAQQASVNAQHASLNVSSIGSVSSASTIASALTAAGVGKTLTEAAKANLWPSDLVMAMMFRAEFVAPLSAADKSSFMQVPFTEEEAYEAGFLIAINRLLDHNQADDARDLVRLRLRTLRLRHGTSEIYADPYQAGIMQRGTAMALHVSKTGDIDESVLRCMCPSTVLTIMRQSVVVPPGVRTQAKGKGEGTGEGKNKKTGKQEYAVSEVGDQDLCLAGTEVRLVTLDMLVESSPRHNDNTTKKSAPKDDTARQPVEIPLPRSRRSLHGGARPRCKACGSPIDSDGDCTSAVCSTHQPRATQSRSTAKPPRVPTGVPALPGLPNTDGSCAVNASIAALSAAISSGPSSSAAARLLRKAADGNASAKQTIIKKCGVEFRPGVTCAREYLRGIVALWEWLGEHYAVVDVPTTYDGVDGAATTALPPKAVGGIYFKGPIPGHWIAVTRRTDGVYTVDDASARQGTPQSDFVLAAVVVKKDDVAGTEAQLKACAERATERAGTSSGQCSKRSNTSGNQCPNGVVPGANMCPAHLYVERGEAKCTHPTKRNRLRPCGQPVAKGLDVCPWHVASEAAKRGRAMPLAGQTWADARALPAAASATAGKQTLVKPPGQDDALSAPQVRLLLGGVRAELLHRASRGLTDPVGIKATIEVAGRRRLWFGEAVGCIGELEDWFVRVRWLQPLGADVREEEDAVVEESGEETEEGLLPPRNDEFKVLALSAIPSTVPLSFPCGQAPSPSLTALKGAYLTELKARSLHEIPALAEQGLSPDVRKRHRAILMQLSGMPSSLTELPLAEAVIKFHEQMAVARKWEATTTLRNLGAAMGALARADMYTNSQVPIVLAWSPAWRDAMRAARLAANEAQPDPPELKVQQFRQAVDQAAAQRRNDLAALLILAFSTGARASDVLELAKSEISIDGTKLMVQFKRGKGVKFRGPYTVHGALSDSSHRQILLDHLHAAETRWAWHAPTPQQRVALTADLLALIRTAGGASLRQSSIRRGALQRMATLGASEEDLMHFSGHTNVRTLRRYLGWNKVSATAERTQALGAKHTAKSPAL